MGGYDSQTNKSLTYKHKTELKLEPYLTQVTDISHRKVLTNLSLSDNRLEIKISQNQRPKISRENSNCKLCIKPRKGPLSKTRFTL